MCLFQFAFARLSSFHVSMVCPLTYVDMSFVYGDMGRSQNLGRHEDIFILGNSVQSYVLMGSYIWTPPIRPISPLCSPQSSSDRLWTPDRDLEAGCRSPVGSWIRIQGFMSLDGGKIHLYFHNRFQLLVQGTKTIITVPVIVSPRETTDLFFSVAH